MMILSIGFSYQIIDLSQRYKNQKEIYAADLNYRNRSLDPDEWLNQEKTQIKLDQANVRLEELSKLQGQIERWAVFFLSLVFFYLGLVVGFSRKTKESKLLVLGFILAALACLPVGLGAPMLEIGAFERNLNLGQIPISANVMGFNVNVEVAQSFAGDMYFYYQSKSVLELIGLLFQQQNWVVGLSILLFSVLFPVLKIGATFALVMRRQSLRLTAMNNQQGDANVSLVASIGARNSWLAFFVEKAGKWSMADVFVVAVFLAFLAFSNMQVGINTDSRVLVGLYFFLGYCLLSLLSSSFVKNS